MFFLILSTELDILYVSPEGSAPFRPAGCCIGMPVHAAAALMAADPQLPRSCLDVLQGAVMLPVTLGHGAEQGYVRRILLRGGIGGARDEIIVVYERDPVMPKADIARLRSQMVQAVEAEFDALAYFDRDDRLVMCNQTYANMHPGPEGPVTVGMRFEDILRRDWRHGALSLSSSQMEEWVAQRLAERAKPYLRKDVTMRDGRVYRLIDRKILDGGRMTLMVDITEVKQIEQRLQDVIHAADFGTWSLDVVHWVVDLDARACTMLGHTTQALSPLPKPDWRAMVHPDDLLRIEDHMADFLAGDVVTYHAEYRMRHRDGHWVWLQARGGVSSHHPDGCPQTLSGILIDISREKSIEADLSLRAAAITATSDGILITDDAGIILDMNPGCARMLGYPPATRLVGHHWSKCFAQDSITAIETRGFAALQREGTWVSPALGRRVDDARVELELSLTRMADGRTVWVSRDVSARNALAREKLELRDSVNRAYRQEMVNLLAAGLTHDLSNLTALISHLSDPAMAGFAMDHETLMVEIHAAARQVVSLLDPIRDLGQRQSMVASTDLGALVTEAADILHLGAPGTLRICTHLPDVPITADLDAMQLMQVLLNLGLNARDALGDGLQTIDLSLGLAETLPPDATLETGVIPDAPFALFTIKDSGSGIPPAVRARIWEPFFTTKKLRGTGLGLFVVADIVRSAGGGIALRTAEGQGTSFFIAWPLSRPSA